MPIIVITPSKAKPKAIRKYVMRDSKTRDELKFAFGCEPDEFDTDFRLLQNAFDKCNKSHNIKYYHIKMSWHPDDHVPPEKAKEMIQEFCDRTNINGCQYAGSIHTDSHTTHGHIVVNNVRMFDSEYGKSGHCYCQSPQDRIDMMKIANEISVEHGYTHSVIDYSTHARERISYGERELIKQGVMPWKEELRNQIREAVSKSSTSDQFKEYLQSHYHVTIKEHKGHYNYYTANMGECDRGCPARRLGNAYDKTQIELDIEMKQEIEWDIKSSNKEEIDYE